MATGLPEVRQDARIQIPGMVDTSTGAESAWQQLSRTAAGVQEELLSRAKRRRLDELEEAGNKAVMRGENGQLQVELMPGSDEFSEAYNASAKSAYLAKAEIDAQEKAVELQNEHALDPEGFKASYQGYARGVVQNAPPEIAPHLETVFERERSATYASLLNSKTRRTRANNLDTLETKAQTVFEDAASLAREGRDGVRSTEFERLSGEYANVLDAQVASQFISPEQRELMLDEFDSRMTQAGVAGSIVNTFETSGETAALEQMQQVRDGGAKGLNGDQVEEAIADARSTIAQRRREQSAARSRLASKIEDHIASIQATGRGMSGINAEAQQLLGPDELDDFVQRQSMARRVHSASQSMLNSTPSEIVQTVESMRPQSGTEGFAARQEAYEGLRNRADDILAARQEDAAAYAQRLPDVQKRYREAARDPDTGLQEAISYSLQAQAELGIPRGQRRAITKNDAKNLVTEITAAPAAERGALMAQLQNQYGQHYDRVFMDLVDEGLDPQNQVLASTVGQPALSQRVATVIQTGSTELRKGLDTQTVNDIEAMVESELGEGSGFRQAFEAADYTGGATAQFNATMQTVKDVAVLMYRQGEADSSSAAKKAARQIVLDKFNVINDDRIRAYVPKQINGRRVDISAVERAADLQQQREMIEAFDPQPFGSPAETTQMLDRERTIRTALNSGFWVTNETNDGMVLMVPFRGGGALPLTNADGERYEVMFENVPGRTDIEARPSSSVLPEQRPGGQ